MAFMKFYVGNEANASSHRDGIYIAIDTKKIFYNGDAYGGSEVDLSNYYTIDQVDGKIGTNVYTGANYISKETNLTDAVLQLDVEIKATNDNLALEHANAEATYAKKTELDNFVEIPTGGTDGQVLKKTSTGVEWGNDNDTIVTVNNTLTSDSTTEALSAAQGKVLNEKIEALEIPEEYTLPTATSSQLGGVKIGEGITVQPNGTISAADDVVTLVNLYAAKGDIAAMCTAGPYITNLYFINSPVTEGMLAGIDTGDYYHLCVKRSTGDNYYETTCSNVADTFPGMDKYFVITNTLLYLKNNVIYHARQGTDAGYFVSNGKGDTLTNVASRFETLAEARAFMREKMLALPTPTVNAASGTLTLWTGTQTEYEGVTSKDANTLYFITEE